MITVDYNHRPMGNLPVDDYETLLCHLAEQVSYCVQYVDRSEAHKTAVDALANTWQPDITARQWLTAAGARLYQVAKCACVGASPPRKETTTMPKRLSDSAKLRLCIDGVVLQTTAKALRVGAISVCLYAAWQVFEEEHRQSGIVRRSAAFYDTHLRRHVQIQIDLY